MILAALILIVSTALAFFYFHAVCQQILRRRFDREYFQSIVYANSLEFPAVRKALEEFGAAVDYPRLRVMLKCDFLALTYLLKNAGNAQRRYSRQEWLLILYFRLAFLSLVARHALKLREKPAILKLTAILQYFANVLGERVNNIRFGNLTASDYLLNV
jgi:hypothetical protein